MRFQHLESIAWVALTIGASVMAVQAAISRVNDPRDEVATVVSYYREIARGLPPVGRIGYLRTTADDTEAVRQLFLAQHALAPRAIVEDRSGVEVVVTGVAAAPASDDVLAREGFAMVDQGPGGIRVYRRMLAR